MFNNKRPFLKKHFFFFIIFLFVPHNKEAMQQCIFQSVFEVAKNALVVDPVPSSIPSAFQALGRVGVLASVIWLYKDAFQLTTDGYSSFISGTLISVNGTFDYGNPTMAGIPFNSITSGATGIYRTNDGIPLKVCSTPIATSANGNCVGYLLTIGGREVVDTRKTSTAGMLPNKCIYAIQTPEYRYMMGKRLLFPIICGLCSAGVIYFAKKCAKNQGETVL